MLRRLRRSRRSCTAPAGGVCKVRCSVVVREQGKGGMAGVHAVARCAAGRRFQGQHKRTHKPTCLEPACLPACVTPPHNRLRMAGAYLHAAPAAAQRCQHAEQDLRLRAPPPRPLPCGRCPPFGRRSPPPTSMWVHSCLALSQDSCSSRSRSRMRSLYCTHAVAVRRYDRVAVVVMECGRCWRCRAA